MHFINAVQARWAKETLCLPSETPNVVAQLLLGAPTIKEVIYVKQLKYFHKLTRLPASRFAAQALVEHESGGWKSSYLLNMAKIQMELDLLHLPPTANHIDKVATRHFLDLTNKRINALPSIPVQGTLVELKRADTAKEGTDWMWLNRAVMGATGIKLVGKNALWRARCQEDNAPNSDFHCVFECSQTANIRKATGVTLFFTSCGEKGLAPEVSYKFFITGLNCEGDKISEDDYMERGRSLASIFKAKMGDNWGWYILIYLKVQLLKELIEETCYPSIHRKVHLLKELFDLIDNVY